MKKRMEEIVYILNNIRAKAPGSSRIIKLKDDRPK